MAGGDEDGDSSSREVIADLPWDHHAEPARASDLECGLVGQTIPGNSLRNPNGRGGIGHLGFPSGVSADIQDQFTINNYLAQARTKRRFSTASRRSSVVLSDLGASSASADRTAFLNVGPSSPEISLTNTSRIVRRPSETAIIQHLNNMTDRGMCTTAHSHFELDEQGRLIESVGHQHGDAHDGHAESLPWYAHPIQRQRWNEDHVLPHVDWGDLFFDLFYVGAAYNLGVMLTSAIATGNWARGIIYYIGTFGPLWMAWANSVYYASRFTCVDYFHWTYEVVRYVFVGTAVAHVSEIKFLREASSAALAFIVAILCEGLMHLGLTVETYFKAEGDRESIKSQCLRDIKYKILPYIAVIVSALAVEISFHLDNNTDNYTSGSRRLAEVDYGDDPYATGKGYVGYNKVAEYHWDYGDLPLTLLAIGYVFNQIFRVFVEWRAIATAKLDIRRSLVPYNVEMLIHRYGEWMLLMIGEGILSLLIVETTPTLSHYIITTCGLLIMIFIQIITFESAPSHAEEHALFRSVASSYAYTYLIQILSLSLIPFGVSYKVLLQNEFAAAQNAVKGYDGSSRLLAAAPKVAPETAATLFSGGLTATLVALELLTLTHGGFEKAWGNVYKSSGNGSAYNWPVILMTVFKIGLFGFTATLNLWISEPSMLTFCGCGVVMLVAFSRVFIFKFTQKGHFLKSISSSIQKLRSRRGAK